MRRAGRAAEHLIPAPVGPALREALYDAAQDAETIGASMAMLALAEALLRRAQRQEGDRQMTQPGPTVARDVNLAEWLNGIGFHPANTEAKQLGHEVARNLVAQFGAVLSWLLPAGRFKSLAFTELESVLLRANQALATGGGPVSGDLDALRELATLRLVHGIDVSLPSDPRIEAYKAEQRGEEAVEPAAENTEAAPEETVQPDEDDAVTFRATIQGDDHGFPLEMVADAHGHYIQVSVTAERAQVEAALNEPDPRATETGRMGMWMTITDPDTLAEVHSKLDEASRVAFGRGGVMIL